MPAALDSTLDLSHRTGTRTRTVVRLPTRNLTPHAPGL